jgi:hypothetical protein
MSKQIKTTNTVVIDDSDDKEDECRYFEDGREEDNKLIIIKAEDALDEEIGRQLASGQVDPKSSMGDEEAGRVIQSHSDGTCIAHHVLSNNGSRGNPPCHHRFSG